MVDTPIVKVVDLVKQVVSPEGVLTLLDQINFSIAAGQSVAIVGASGSGKSTLLGLVAGLDLPSRGEIWIAGQNIAQLDEDQRAVLRAAQIGFVFQSFYLLPSLTALENVMLPLELAGNGGAKDRAAALLQRVGLEKRLAHYPNQLSGGEQQRVALARAFATQPRLLLADEPTGSLDNQTGRRVIELLLALNAEFQTTLLLVTHDQQLADRCQRRLTLVEGRLAQ